MKRRPSFATVIALLALFVALGGPAEAGKLFPRGSVKSATVKDHSLKVRDLTRSAVSQLKSTPNGSITEAKLANGSVTPGKLAPGSVGSAAIADHSVTPIDLATNAVTGTQIADGTLNARDLGRYFGRFQLKDPIPQLHPGECWSGVPADLPAERAKADISQDLVLVTPDATWPQDQLSLTVKVERLDATQPKPGRFVLAACNVSVSNSDPFRPSFRYLIIDLP